MNKSIIPYWIMSGDLNLKAYYQYPSATRSKLFNFDLMNLKRENFSELDLAFFERVEKELEKYKIVFDNDEEANARMDNKMVLEVEIEEHIFYIGFYDNCFSIGLSAVQKDNVKPRKLKLK